MEPQDWIPARRRRILLAGFLDFCLLTASFGLLNHWAYVLEPQIGDFPLYAQILAFLVIEYLLLARLRWSPGLHLLSIRLLNKCRRSLRNGNWPFSESRSCYFYS